MGLPTRTFTEESGRRATPGPNTGKAVIIGLSQQGDLLTPTTVVDSAPARALFGEGQMIEELEAFLIAGGQEADLIRIAEDSAGSVGDPVLDGTGEATAASGGTPTYPAEIVLEFTKAGACATAEYKASYDGGQTFGGDTVTPASAVAITLDNGATITFTDAGVPADSFDVGDMWYLKVLPGSPTNAAILQALSIALQPVYDDWQQCIISPPADVTLYNSLDSECDDQHEAGKPRVIMVNPETFSEYFIDNVDCESYQADDTPTATGTATTALVGLPFGLGNFKQVYVMVTTGGAFGVAEVAISYDGGRTYDTPFKPVADTPFFLDGLCMTLAFGAGVGPDFVVDEYYVVGDTPLTWQDDLKTVWLAYRGPWVHTPACELWLANSDGSSFIGRPAGLAFGAYAGTKLGYSPACVDQVRIPSTGFVGPITEFEGEYEVVLDNLTDSKFVMFRYESGYGFCVGWGVSRDVDGSIHDIIESVLVNAFLTYTESRQLVPVTGTNMSAPGAFSAVTNLILAGGKIYEDIIAIEPGSFQAHIYSTAAEIRANRVIEVGWSYQDTLLVKDLEVIASVTL